MGINSLPDTIPAAHVCSYSDDALVGDVCSHKTTFRHETAALGAVSPGAPHGAPARQGRQGLTLYDDGGSRVCRSSRRKLSGLSGAVNHLRLCPQDLTRNRR